MKIMMRLAILSMLLPALLFGCSFPGGRTTGASGSESERPSRKENDVSIPPDSRVTELEKGFSAVSYEGDDGFAAFLSQGGASSDKQVADFLTARLKLEDGGVSFRTQGFGCSAVSVKSPEGDALFGRNFDWQKCNAMVVQAAPADGYASISTVNMDFLDSAAAFLKILPDEARTAAALYAPLDGMNEKGLCAAVLMIEDNASIDQQTDKPDITTTTAIRLLLNRASNVEEAVALLKQYDMHASMGLMVHFALSDAEGKSVVVEYINNEMVVIETPAATNFYLAEGEKNGIGSAQSHTRYETLTNLLAENKTMGEDQVRDALESVGKHHFNDGETTEWSIVYNQADGTARYYHRENYDKSYLFSIG